MSDDEETFEDFCDDIIVHDDVEDGDLDFTFTELKEDEKKMCSKCGYWFTLRNLEDGGMCSRCAYLVKLNNEWRVWAEEDISKDKVSHLSIRLHLQLSMLVSLQLELFLISIFFAFASNCIGSKKNTFTHCFS